MELFVIRHGEAVDVGSRGVARDEDRFLTGHGRKRCAQLGKAMRRLGIEPSVVLCSPLLRARESADALADAFGDVPVSVCDLLAPPGDGDRLIKLLHHMQTDALALVGHEPFLGELVGRFVTGRADVGIPLAKSAAACIRLPRWEWGAGDLEWILHPSLIKAILG